MTMDDSGQASRTMFASVGQCSRSVYKVKSLQKQYLKHVFRVKSTLNLLTPKFICRVSSNSRLYSRNLSISKSTLNRRQCLSYVGKKISTKDDIS